MGTLKSTVGAGLTALAMITSASAADLSRPPPVAPAPVFVPPPFSWSGFYIGGNLGGAWGHGNITDVLNPGVSFNSGNNGVFIGGGQVGFNYQVSSIVFGAEADFDWAANNNNTTTGVVTPLGIFTVSANDRWISTFAGRLGVAFDRWLVYAKGGGAWVGTNNFTVTNVPTNAQVSGGSSNNTGWLFGAGVEWAFAGNWTARLEYDYIGLSSRTFAVPLTSPFLAGDVFTTGSNNVQMFTVGINYLFNFGGPVTARY
jgi:outer membrane immunogenic protein